MPDTAIDPKIASSYADEGRALVRAGRDVDALRAFERAAWMAPDDPRIQWALANILWRLGRGADAVPVYERVIALLPSEAAPHCNLAELLAVLGRGDDARVQITAAVSLAPHAPHIHFAETILRLAQHRPAAAEEAARRGVASGILPKFAYLNLGNSLLALGRSAAALDAYRVARQHCTPEDLRTMRQDLDWLAAHYPDLPKATYRQALALFTPESHHG